MSAELTISDKHIRVSLEIGTTHRSIVAKWIQAQDDAIDIDRTMWVPTQLCLHAANMPKEASQGSPQDGERVHSQEELIDRLTNLGVSRPIAEEIAGLTPYRFAIVSLLVGNRAYIGIVDQTAKTSPPEVPYRIYLTSFTRSKNAPEPQP